MCRWIHEQLGDEVPLHFTAFHPDFHLQHIPATSLASLQQARAIAQQAGLQHVYLGNRSDRAGGQTP